MTDGPFFYRSRNVARAEELTQEAQYLDRRADPKAIETWLQAAALYEQSAILVPVEELPFTRRQLFASAVAAYERAGCIEKADALRTEASATVVPHRSPCASATCSSCTRLLDA